MSVKLTECTFSRAWIGPCKTKTDRADGYCVEHSREKCWKCKEQATGECDNAGFMVCGTPECSKHPHQKKHNDDFDKMMAQKECPTCHGTGKVAGSEN